MQARRGPLANIIGGPVLGEGPEEHPLRHHRDGEVADTFRPEARYPGRLDGSHAYLGIAFGHFGHVMSEMIHRILPMRAHRRRVRWVAVGAAREGPQRFSRIARRVLRFLDVAEENCTILTQNTVVERLMVAEAGSHLGRAAHPAYLEMLDAFTLPRLDRHKGERTYPEKVYVSRSALGPHSGYLGERVLEEALAASGYAIFRPDEHGLVEQLQTYRHAKVLIFGEGSACHGTELFGRSLGHTLLLNRRQLAQDQFVPVLAPRSRRFDHFRGNRPIGTMYVHGENRPLLTVGVTLFDIPALTAFLSAAGVDAPEVPLRHYLDAAEDDLEAYIAAERKEAYVKDPARAEPLRQGFREAARALLA